MQDDHQNHGRVGVSMKGRFIQRASGKQAFEKKAIAVVY
jgi:hypothetical protein